MTIKRKLTSALILATVAGLSYAAGAAKAPVNTPAGELKFEPIMPNAPVQMAILWGDRNKGGDYGMLLKIPVGSDSGLHAHSADYHGVTVQGTWVHTNEGEPAHELPPGSHVMQPAKQFHSDNCKGTTDCIVFVHQHAKGDYIPKPAPKGEAKPAEKK